MPFDVKTTIYSVKIYNFPDKILKSVGNIEILEGFLTRKLTRMFSKLTILEIIPLLFHLFKVNDKLSTVFILLP